MSRVVIIGMGASPCALMLQASISVAAVPFALIDDTIDPGAEVQLPSCSAARIVASDYSVTRTTEYFRLPSDREMRQQNQPFYRGLKKYRKP